jgi:DNA gyrase subunit B
MHELLRQPDVDLNSAQAASDSAQRLAGRVKDVEIAAEFDEIHERYRLKIMRVMHGNIVTSYLDSDFLDSGDYAQIRKTAQVFDGLIGQGAYVQRGERKQTVSEFKQALEWLLDEAKKGVNIQRYKGLGEMNPSQLWETTMDPQNRRLLRAQIEDSILTDEIFTTLMGDVVEPRRVFIERNALRATNIDI